MSKPSSKHSKEDYEDVINKLLGTTIKWGKLSLEDLIQFATLLDHPSFFMEKLGVPKDVTETKTTAAPLIRGVLDVWGEVGHGPLAKLWRKLQTEQPPQPKT